MYAGRKVKVGVSRKVIQAMTPEPEVRSVFSSPGPSHPEVQHLNTNAGVTGPYKGNSMALSVIQPKPVDVGGMLRRASNRVSLRSLLNQKGDRHMHVLSRELLDKLINQAIAETVRRLRDEGAMTLALTEQRLASESRKELAALMSRLQSPAPSAPADVEVYFAEDEADRALIPFEGEDLDLGRGLDLGSVNICASARSRSTGNVLLNIQRNAFIDVRADGFTQSLLRKFGVDCVVHGDRAYVIGDPAFEVATAFDKALKRPLKDGPGSTTEPEGAFIIGHLLERVLGRARTPGEICAYSVPAEPVDADRNFIYHQGVLEEAIRRLGFTPRPMLESHVIIQAEFKETQYTGIGITCGGSTFNLCVACKGVPALTFSTSRGGDWVDRNVAAALGLPLGQVCAAKERGINLFQPKDHLEGAIAIYYRHLIQYTLETFQQRLHGVAGVPTFRDPVDIVCAGGSALIGGFLEMFRQELEKIAWPMEIGKVRLAQNPQEAVAAGCLRAALEETRALEETPMTMSPSVSVRTEPAPSRSAA
jgi:hypothetical protein